ncbi:ORAOV1 family [Lecanosticta acicola]|uniref:ORAOV1 family n=1 Tax=Lecanosticta acicola TaxID=111012 RepID=A0AAI9EAI5_9PEZI|nr:ORAOV1 family [Lecanosticta acicola]
MATSEERDVFEDALNLEDRYYSEGYSLGVADGSKSGRIEGRIFGLEKGFEKFVEMGKLNGRAAVWEARLPENLAQDGAETALEEKLPPIGRSDRLQRHIERLAALSDPDDLSTTNEEDTVSEFDDRLKDAKAKARLIDRIAGEEEPSVSVNEAGQEAAKSGTDRTFRVRRTQPSGAGRGAHEMEDFAGLPSRGI